MPSSKDRQRVEIPTKLYERLKLIADGEERTLTSLLQDVIRRGLAEYQPLWVPHRYLHRFTQPAQRVLALAKEEAQATYLDYVGTEHILIGLLREGDGIAARVLRDLWVETDETRKALASIQTRTASRSTTTLPPNQADDGARAPSADVAAATSGIGPEAASKAAADEGPDFTLRARNILALAVDEAQRMHAQQVGTEHILLALAREGEGLAAGILQTFGALDKVREFTLAEIARRDAQTRGESATA